MGLPVLRSFLYGCIFKYFRERHLGLIPMKEKVDFDKDFYKNMSKQFNNLNNKHILKISDSAGEIPKYHKK